MKARMSEEIRQWLEDYRNRNRRIWSKFKESLLRKEVKENAKICHLIRDIRKRSTWNMKIKEDEFIKKLRDEYELAQHEYIECLERETGMKFKAGHITNSSSVSFVGWGIQISLLDQLAYGGIPKKFFDEVYNLYLEHCKKHDIETIPIEDFCYQALSLDNKVRTYTNDILDGEINRWYFEFFRIIADQYSFICDVSIYSEKIFTIGKSSLEIPDDMTARFYKEFIKSNLKKLGFDIERFSEISTMIEV